MSLFNWNQHPRSFALLIAFSALCGIVGMLLDDGVWDLLFFALASLPLGIGLLAYWRATRGDSAG